MMDKLYSPPVETSIAMVKSAKDARERTAKVLELVSLRCNRDNK